MSDSGMDLRELYQDIILDHGRHPRNFRALEHPTHLARGHNPLCGDRVTVYLVIEGDRIADVSFEGRGCAISTAAASRVTGGEPGEPPEAMQDEIERLEPLTGVKAFPVRVKCATLPWHAFEAALKTGLAGDTVKTE